MNLRRIFLTLLILSPFSSVYGDKFSETQQALVKLGAQERPMKFIEAELITLGFDPKKLPFVLDFSGYIKGESFLDSRQTLDFRAGQLLLVPLEYLPDIHGRDINSRGRYNMSAIETRCRLDINGPVVHGWKTRGYIEADFFGTTDFSINTFFLRNAYMELQGEHARFLAGQTYHPLVYPLEAPGTISFSGPLNAFAFNPQFRFGYESKNLSLYVSFCGRVFLDDDGPIGPSSLYFRNSMMPEINFHGRVKNEGNFVGASLNIRRIVPRLVTNKNIKSVEHLTNIGLSGYFCYDAAPLTFFGKVIYVENGSPFAMVGGYAVSCADSQTDKRTYTNIRFLSAWLEIIYDCCTFEPAIFGGYGKNIGATRPVITSITTDGIVENTIYGFGNDIDTVARVSPRVRCYYYTPFIICTELEWTRASYGTIDGFGKVHNAIPVNNYRWELACYYIF